MNNIVNNISVQSPFKPVRPLGKRTPIRITQEELVTSSPLSPGQKLPLLIEPRVGRIDVAAWIASQREWIVSQLYTSGGILLRGFQIASVAEFEQVCRALSGELMEYSYRSTPRHTVEGHIYTSTEYPEDQNIPLHNENSYAGSWPMKIWFYCRQPAVTGGQSPIADSRRVFQRISPEIRERFAAKQVMYVRNYGSGIDLPWQTVFQTNTPAEVEAFCRAAQIDWKWEAGDRLKTWQVRQAVAQHPQTGEMVWFNQAHLFHITNLPADVRESLLETFGEEGLPRHSFYGDGSAIEPEALAEIRRAYEEETIEFDWESGDLLLLDNMLTAHSRRPYTGPRSVLVGMAEPNQTTISN